MKKKFFWQPDLPIAIIYWSLTFFILFFSLILSLENTKPYLTSNLVLGVFFFFFVLGLRRRFVLTTEALKIKKAAFWLDQAVPLDEIKSVQLQPKGIKLWMHGQNHGVNYLMREDKKRHFAAKLADYSEKIETHDL